MTGSNACSPAQLRTVNIHGDCCVVFHTPRIAASRIFVGHSSSISAEAVCMRDWLAAEGWADIFLDFNPERGIAAGEHWERALNQA